MSSPATIRVRRIRWSRMGRVSPLMLGAGILILWLLVAIFAPLIAPHDPIYQYAAVRLQPPSWEHPLGTDNFGRDMLSRVIWGSRIDFQIALFGVVFPFILGTIVGSVAGFFGGWVDTVFMRVIDVVLAFPFLVLMLAIITIIGPGLGSFYIAMALVGWVSYARLIRAQFLVLKNSDFAIAAVSLGYSNTRVMFRHIMPNAILSSVVFSMSDAVLVLLNGAAISYLGLGVQPPVAEWGVMIAEGQGFISSAWWITTFPGIAIVTLAMGFSLMADGLGEALGVRE